MPEFAHPLVAKAYLQAAIEEQVPGDCGLTPLEHFIIGEDGIARLQSDHIHGGLITGGTLHV